MVQGANIKYSICAQKIVSNLAASTYLSRPEIQLSLRNHFVTWFSLARNLSKPLLQPLPGSSRLLQHQPAQLLIGNQSIALLNPQRLP